VIKGGTALNLFIFNVPRLSVDIDFNYTGSLLKETMLEERPRLEQALRAVCDREGYVVRKIPESHAGGKWLIRYRSASGQGGNLEIDVNFMFRQPLWQPIPMDTILPQIEKARDIPILDIHEQAAGKLAALFGRHTSRDLFDSHHILGNVKLDKDRLRVAFVVYGGINRKDWRKIKIEDVRYQKTELRNELIPLLRTSVSPISWDAWAENMVVECQTSLNIVLPFFDREMEFLDRLLTHGEIRPNLLTQQDALADRIRNHPGLEWKALNVLKRKGC
jgi:predicted nucleotidyltransferase component of viral defense system